MGLDASHQVWMATVYRDHAPELLRWMASRFRVDLQEAGDLLQEATMKLIAELNAGGRPSEPVAWLRTVLTRLFIDRYRQRRSRDERSIDDEAGGMDVEQLEALDGGFPSPEELLAQHQLRQCVQEGLARFAATRKGHVEQLLALRLVVLDGCSLDEVAVMLGRTPGGAMRVFMHACRRAARAYLEHCWSLRGADAGGGHG